MNGGNTKMLFNKKAENVIVNAQIVTRWTSDIQRREKAKLNKDYYKNLCKEYLLDYVKDTYQTQKTQEIASKYIDPTFVASWLIDSLYKTFETGFNINIPKYEKNETSKETFNQILSDIDFKNVLNQIDKFVGVNRDCHVSPIVVDKNKIALDIITSEKASVTQKENYPLEIKEFFFFAQNEVDSPNQAQSNFNEIFMYDENGKLYKMPMLNVKSYHQDFDFISLPDKSQMVEVENQPNYNQIPVICFSDYVKDDSYWYDGENKIINSAFEIDKRNCELAYATAMQIPMKLGKNIVDGVDINAGHNAVTIIPPNNTFNNQEPTIEFLSPDNHIAELRNNIKEKILDLAISLGFSKDQITGVSATSGYQLMLSKQEIINRNIARRSFYEKSMKKLIQMITIAGNKAGYKIIPLSDAEANEIKIEWNNFKYVQSDEEKSKELTMKLANKEISLIEYEMKENNLTEEEAIDVIKKRLEYIKLAQPTVDLQTNQLTLAGINNNG